MSVISDRQRRSKVVFTGERGKDMAKQSFGKECDVNEIIKKAARTGMISVTSRQPLYGDFTLMPDYMEVQSRLAVANEQFMRLPAELRERFGNSPQKLFDFLGDEANHDEAVRLGLLAPKEVKKNVEKAGEPSGKVAAPGGTGQPGSPVGAPGEAPGAKEAVPGEGSAEVRP